MPPSIPLTTYTTTVVISKVGITPDRVRLLADTFAALAPEPYNAVFIVGSVTLNSTIMLTSTPMNNPIKFSI